MAILSDEKISMSQWIFAGIMGLLSLFGLFLASRAHDQMLSVAGFLLFAFGVGFIFWLIAKNTGHPTDTRPGH
jgi:hypothetical protein